MAANPENDGGECQDIRAEILEGRELIIASNRGPVSWQYDENGEMWAQRGGGGLVTALIGLSQHLHACWIASAMSDADRNWQRGEVAFGGDAKIQVKMISPAAEAYDGYYNVISNPLLWFLQHSMWDHVRAPTIDARVWDAWENGYVTVNREFGEAIAEEINESTKPVLVMLQDYHLYLASRQIRARTRPGKKYSILHFIHIPWPGSEDWWLLPPKIRYEILDGLCAVDLLGFQTREDGQNFIRTCESLLPGCRVSYRRGWVRFRGHTTHVRDYPISIDVQALKELSETEEEVERHWQILNNRFGHFQLIVRVDRTEPSKNIARGFQAYEELLELYPEHRSRVMFLAILVPSRLEVEEYQTYLDELMAAAGRVNARYGDSEWEPVRVMVGENYHRAIAALKLYDVLLVNSIADGMNLVAKEGPTVNQRDGVVILSERTGARQQLGPGALIISPLDIYTTAQALHTALTMPDEERARRAQVLRRLVEQEDITAWLCRQLAEMESLGL